MNLQNLSQEQQPKSFELEGGEQEVDAPQHDVGEQSMLSRSQQMLRDGAIATGSTGHEFTLAKNEFKNPIDSDQKQPIMDNAQ